MFVGQLPLMSKTDITYRENWYTASGAVAGGAREDCMNNVLLPTLFTLVNNILFNIVDNCEQCGQQNIVQSCFH
jgi:hypothetical protein